MAKRAPSDEKPYRPLLDPGVISAALTKATGIANPATPKEESQGAAAIKVVEIARPEPRPHLPQKPDPSLAPAAQTAPRVEVRSTPSVLVEKFDQEKRILLTRSEAAILDRLVSSLAGRLGTQVKLSHVLRASITLLLNAEREIDRRAGEAGVLVRPPNGDGKALSRFEREIAGVISAAIRDAGPLR